jgi:hypothetical protein
MKLLSCVVRAEGMYLGPHQFQVQSRYFEDSIQCAASPIWSGQSSGVGGPERQGIDADAERQASHGAVHPGYGWGAADFSTRLLLPHRLCG